MPDPRNLKPGSPPYLKDPRQERAGEKISGGFFVFRRTANTGRIRAPEWPFEHPSFEAAAVERSRLAALHPEERFVIVGDVERVAEL